MLADVKWVANLKTLVAYHEQKVSRGVAERIYAGNFLNEAKDLTTEMIHYHFNQFLDLRDDVKKPLLHVSVNFHPDDASGLSQQKLQNISREYMKAIGMHKQPYVVYLHTDAAHPHFHIISPRISGDSHPICIVVKWEYQKMVKAMEQKYQLTPSGRKHVSREPASWRDDYAQKVEYGVAPTVPAMAKAIESVTDKYKFTTLSAYNSALREYNVQAKEVSSRLKAHQHRGLIYRALDSKGNNVGTAILASRFYCKPTLPNLEKKFRENARLMERPRAFLTSRIDSVAEELHANIQGYFRALEDERITTIIRHNKRGQIHEFSYVDHENCCVFEEKDLPEQCSARTVLSRFGYQELLVDRGEARANSPEPLLVRESEPRKQSQTGKGLELELGKEPELRKKKEPPKKPELIKFSVATELLEGSPLAEQFKRRGKTPTREKVPQRVPDRSIEIPRDF